MRISVITINYNDKAGLLKTIRSVVGQTVAPFEFIVIDGGSNDGSKDIMEAFQSHFTYWVSEPDKGIYNAMNKGIDHATGEWCLFLNSGDSFSHDSVLEQMCASGAHADIICGNSIMLSDPPIQKKSPATITFDFLYDGTICHQCAFIRTAILQKYHYDEKYKIVADRKLFVQALVLDNVSYETVDIDIADYDITGFSSRNRFESQLEYRRVLEELIPKRILSDYGLRHDGVLHGTTPYEELFMEIGKRKYRRLIYKLVYRIMKGISLFKSSARFIHLFPKSI